MYSLLLASIICCSEPSDFQQTELVNNTPPKMYRVSWYVHYNNPCHYIKIERTAWYIDLSTAKQVYRTYRDYASPLWIEDNYINPLKWAEGWIRKD